MRRVLITAIWFISMFLPNSALAWGQEGHSIVAEIAQRRLDKSAAERVADALGANVSLASVASWADDVRESRPETYNWHFVSIPLDATDYRADRDCIANPAQGDCVVAAIERTRKEFFCAPDRKQRAEALKFLAHFMGDLHQPLHTVKEEVGMTRRAVTYRIGGNTCGTRCDFHELKSEDDHLHAVWDSALIRKNVWAWGEYVDNLEEGWLASSDLDAVKIGDPATWAVETHLVAAEVMRNTPPKFLDDLYFKAQVPALDQQLAKGGVRLAKLLNEPVPCS